MPTFPAVSCGLSVVIPARDEEHRLDAVLEEATAYLTAREGSWELLVVNDGSTDKTSDVVARWSRRCPQVRLIELGHPQGKGAAVRGGMQQAAGKFRLFRDADRSVRMDEFDRFLPLLKEGRPVVIGSRRAAGSLVVKPQAPWRTFMGCTFSFLSRLVTVWEVKDFTCGFKAFSAEAAGQIFGRQRLNRWAFDAEILFLARRSGFPITQVPVTWADEPGSKVRIIRDTATSLKELALIRLNDWRGLYD
jgi:glycosyltransferase involved in cell wall biosynthesis